MPSDRAETIRVAALTGVTEIAPDAWDALVDDDDPFLEHAFLAALERSGSVGPETGWEPRILVARQGNRVVGAVPLYLKHDSMGEFIWDFAWAHGARNAGIRYFPKLVAAVPFTPAAGHRLLVHPVSDRPTVASALIQGMRDLADENKASSIHVLFCREDDAQALTAAGFLRRASFQYHWQNRQPEPYRDFDDFLAGYRSRNRKQVRHERATVNDFGLRIEVASGTALDDRAWSALDAFYRNTVDQYGNIAFLTPAFFREIRRTHAERVVAALAYQGEEPVAGTINFTRKDRLLGRYWGAAVELPMLHFELCYYRLIEHAITHRLQTFEGGAGGEHKLSRGFEPALTFSAHQFMNARLDAAVRRRLEVEGRERRAALARWQTESPVLR